MGCSLSSCIYNDSSGESSEAAYTAGKDNNGSNKTRKSRKFLDTVMSKQTQQPTINENEIDLSHFVISDKIIGLGGFGLIRQVTKISGDDKGKIYALKSLSKRSVVRRSSGPSAVMTELTTLALLKDCKFICNIHYGFQDDAFLYMVMDLCRGGDMRYNLKVAPQNRFSEKAAKFYFACIALGLERCHLLSIIHRDIKPENIVMTETGYLKLTDFGVAKILHASQECTSTSGTHGYMAPEVYMPRHRHGTSSDWFSLGITLHEFITGSRPFETSRLQAFRNGYVTDNLPLTLLDKITYASKDCKDVINGLLDVKAARRIGARYGLDELKQHRWFKDFDWTALCNQTMKPPIKPDISYGRYDMKGTEIQAAIQAHLESLDMEEDQGEFQNYEFSNRPYHSRNYDNKSMGLDQIYVSKTPYIQNVDDRKCGRENPKTEIQRIISKEVKWYKNVYDPKESQIQRSSSTPELRLGKSTRMPSNTDSNPEGVIIAREGTGALAREEPDSFEELPKPSQQKVKIDSCASDMIYRCRLDRAIAHGKVAKSAKVSNPAARPLRREILPPVRNNQAGVWSSPVYDNDSCDFDFEEQKAALNEDITAKDKLNIFTSHPGRNFTDEKPSQLSSKWLQENNQHLMSSQSVLSD